MVCRIAFAQRFKVIARAKRNRIAGEVPKQRDFDRRGAADGWGGRNVAIRVNPEHTFAAFGKFFTQAQFVDPQADVLDDKFKFK